MANCVSTWWLASIAFWVLLLMFAGVATLSWFSYVYLSKQQPAQVEQWHLWVGVGTLVASVLFGALGVWTTVRAARNEKEWQQSLKALLPPKPVPRPKQRPEPVPRPQAKTGHYRSMPLKPPLAAPANAALKPQNEPTEQYGLLSLLPAENAPPQPVPRPQ